MKSKRTPDLVTKRCVIVHAGFAVANSGHVVAGIGRLLSSWWPRAVSATTATSHKVHANESNYQGDDEPLPHCSAPFLESSAVVGGQARRSAPGACPSKLSNDLLSRACLRIRLRTIVLLALLNRSTRAAGFVIRACCHSMGCRGITYPAVYFGEGRSGNPKDEGGNDCEIFGAIHVSPFDFFGPLACPSFADG